MTGLFPNPSRNGKERSRQVEKSSFFSNQPDNPLSNKVMFLAWCSLLLWCDIAFYRATRQEKPSLISNILLNSCAARNSTNCGQRVLSTAGTAVLHGCGGLAAFHRKSLIGGAAKGIYEIRQKIFSKNKSIYNQDV